MHFVLSKEVSIKRSREKYDRKYIHINYIFRAQSSLSLSSTNIYDLSGFKVQNLSRILRVKRNMWYTRAVGMQLYIANPKYMQISKE